MDVPVIAADVAISRRKSAFVVADMEGKPSYWATTLSEAINHVLQKDHTYAILRIENSGYTLKLTNPHSF